jgi:hypothetical protein
MEPQASFRVTLTPSGFRHEPKARLLFAGGAAYILVGTGLLVALAFAAIVRTEIGMILGLLLGLAIAAVVIWIGSEWMRLSLCLAWSRIDIDASEARVIVTRSSWRPCQIEIPAADFGYTFVARPMHVACELGILTRRGQWLQLAIGADEERIRYIAEQITSTLVAHSSGDWRVELEHIDLVQRLARNGLLVPRLDVDFVDDTGLDQP